jgi:hypothetical protein
VSARPISEKAAEILFNRFLLQSFPLGGVQLFAPSSIDEFKKGYDTSVAGFSSLREVYLQFKAPLYSESRARFTVSLTPHQHRLLKGLYPPRSAYYVAAMFRSLAELNSAQAAVQTAADFLKNFVCIEVAALPLEVDFFHYIQPSSHRESPLVRFKTPSDGPTRSASHPVNSDGWLRGSTLLAKLKAGKIGVHRDLMEGYPRMAGEALREAQADANLDADERLSGAEFGVLVRIPTSQ